MQVDGTNTYDAAVGIACQEVPAFAPRKGKYAVAASFVMRVFKNKVCMLYISPPYLHMLSYLLLPSLSSLPPLNSTHNTKCSI